MISYCIVFTVSVLLVLGRVANAFSPASSFKAFGCPRWNGVRDLINDPLVLRAEGAKKKRRRRKDEGSSSSPAPIDDGDLPDFDLVDTTDVISPSMEGSKLADSDLGRASMRATENDAGLMEAMRGTGNSAAAGSAKDLLSSRDRSLEATFEFDEVEAPLPRMGRKKNADIAYDIPPPPGVGKKRARDEARRAAAIKAAEESQKQEGFLSSLPFVGTKDGEPVSPLKVLETGAWIGIAALIAWELYLNSPLFDRAAPMAPVVYEFFL